MSNTLNRLLVEKLGGRNADSYIGNLGDVFFDPSTTSLRISDGSTAGGLSLTGGSSIGNPLVLGKNSDFTIRTSADLMSSPPSVGTYNFTFKANGNLVLPGNIEGTLNQDILFLTKTNQMSSPPSTVTRTIRLSANGNLTLPSDLYFTGTTIQISGTDPDADLYIGNSVGQVLIGTLDTPKVTIGGFNNGSVCSIPTDRFQILSLAPTSSKGTEGDEPGMIAFSASHAYFCTGTYNGISDIWRRVAITGGTW